MLRNNIPEKLRSAFIILISSEVFLIFLLLGLFALILVSSFEPDSVFNAVNSEPAIQLSNLNNWFEKGYSWMGIRLVISSIIRNPFILSLLMIFLAVLIFIVFIFEYFRRLVEHDEETIQNAAEDQNLNHEDLKLLNIKQSFNAMISERNRRISSEIEKTKKMREQYENSLHQIRSKLNTLYFVAEELPESSSDKVEMKETLDECDRLIRDSLSQSIYESICLSELIKRVSNEKTKQIQKKKLTLKMSLDDKTNLYGCELWMKEVIDAALQNAIENSPAESDIDVQTARKRSGIIYVSIMNKTAGNHSISDSSFERYSSKSSSAGHFGIGLNLIKNISEEHHGKVRSSSKNECFKVELYFPVSRFEF